MSATALTKLNKILMMFSHFVPGVGGGGGGKNVDERVVCICGQLPRRHIRGSLRDADISKVGG